MLCRVENRFTGFLLGLYDETKPWRALNAYARDCGFENWDTAKDALRLEPGEIVVTPVVGDWKDRRWHA